MARSGQPVRDLDPALKVARSPVDDQSMVLLLAFLTASYFTVVVLVRRARRQVAAPVTEAVAARLPAEDQPPASAVGWPPKGARFTTYVDEGFAAIDAYLQDGYAA